MHIHQGIEQLIEPRQHFAHGEGFVLAFVHQRPEISACYQLHHDELPDRSNKRIKHTRQGHMTQRLQLTSNIFKMWDIGGIV
ncbi:MAG: hypothetical protein HC893_07835 [Chloroflexaceae bacterium]|nr:hypothetical protein [Chloroflexaceae bacterium]